MITVTKLKFRKALSSPSYVIEYCNCGCGCVQTLERHVQNLSKNHKHQLSTERTKEQELERQIEKLQEKYDKLEIDMKVAALCCIIHTFRLHYIQITTTYSIQYITFHALHHKLCLYAMHYILYHALHCLHCIKLYCSKLHLIMVYCLTLQPLQAL